MPTSVRAELVEAPAGPELVEGAELESPIVLSLSKDLGLSKALSATRHFDKLSANGVGLMTPERRNPP